MLSIYPLSFFTIAAIAADSQLALPSFDLNKEPEQPQSNICGGIVRAASYSFQSWFYASDAIECLTSVPFNDAVATRFLDYYNQTLQFQSNSAYLKQPPSEYRQPPIDLFGGLQEIKNNVTAGYYKNQYAFEAAVQSLLQATHDTHLVLYGGIMSAFTFASPFQIVSISKDGIEVPEIYVYDDVITYDSASPIESIDEIPIIDYLELFAQRNAQGMVEPHADWNTLMTSPAQEIIGSANSFSGGAPFYPGDDMTIQFKNGSSYSTWWLALYNSPGFTGPLETGGDFFNYFALGIRPANYDVQAEKYYNGTLFGSDPDIPDPSNVTGLTSWNSFSSAYPADTISYQKLLGRDSSGFVTGYFLEEVNAAVLSIPSFIEYGDGIGTFSEAIGDFIRNATEREASKVIIDLQQNSGGAASLAFDVLRYFFPKAKPYAGSRMRYHHDGDVLGTAITAWHQSLKPNASSAEYQISVAEEWNVRDRVNPDTKDTFKSWSEFYNPQTANGDKFSKVQQYNLENSIFDDNALGIAFPSCYFHHNCTSSNVGWKAGDITLLTDGLCTSTCALFVEMMQEAGAKTVVIGGQPDKEPMQAASGSRGAAAYNSDKLAVDFYLAAQVDDTAAKLEESRAHDTGIQIRYAGITLRDQMRPEASVPNQFRFLPADCRIFYTMDNFYNYTRLWLDTYNAMYKPNASLCVNSQTKTQSKRSDGLQKRSSGLGAFVMQGLTPLTKVQSGDQNEDEKVEAEGEKIEEELNGDNKVEETAPLDPTFFEGVQDGNGNPGVRPVICTGNPRICDQYGGICEPVNFPCRLIDESSCDKSGCNYKDWTSRQSICKAQCRNVQGPNAITPTCGQNAFCGSLTLSNTQKRSVHWNYKTIVAKPGYEVGSGLCEPWSLGSGESSCASIDWYAVHEPKTLAQLIGTTLSLP